MKRLMSNPEAKCPLRHGFVIDEEVNRLVRGELNDLQMA
jgi:hypothetical protein